MTPEQIIDQADRRTDRRGDKKLNLRTEFSLVLQDFCLRYRWHWRRLSYTFPTVAETASYDLSSSSVVASGFVEGVVPHRFLKDGVRLFTGTVSNGGQPEYVCLEPIFEEHIQDIFLQDTTQGQPVAYFMEPGSTSSLHLAATPNGIWTIRASFWGVPVLTEDQLPAAVPLVPTFLHQLLVKGLEAQILRYLLGEGSAKYVAANSEYEAGIARAYGSRDFAEGRIREFRDMSGEAIQSTGDSCYPGRASAYAISGSGSSSSSSSSGSEGTSMVQHPLTGALDGVNCIFIAVSSIPATHLVFGDGSKLALNDPDGYTVNDNTITCAHPPGTIELWY